MRCEAVKFWDKIKNEFALKSYDIVDYNNPLVYVGMMIGKIKRNDKVWYTIDQTSELVDFLHDKQMMNVRHVSAPMPYKNEMYSDDTLLSMQQHEEYRSMVGSLVYFALLRYDIAHDVSRLSAVVSKPTKGAMKALNRVMAYLASTVDKQLLVCRVNGNTWHINSHSDHAGDK